MVPEITPTVEETSVDYTVNKVWDDGNDSDGVRPYSATFHLLANGVDTGKSAQATASNGWTVSFGDLPKMDVNGNEISYTITEEAIGENTELDAMKYEATIGQPVVNADGDVSLTISNYHMTNEEYDKVYGEVLGARRRRIQEVLGARRRRGSGTGDDSNMGLYANISAMAGIGLVIWLVVRKCRNTKQ